MVAKKDLTPTERAALVALYRQHHNIKKVKAEWPDQTLGERTIRRFLHEEGVVGSRIKHPARRGRPSVVMSKRKETTPSLLTALRPENELTWVWFAGVFDARGSITHRATKAAASIQAISVSTVDEMFCELIATLLGVGITVPVGKTDGPTARYRWQVSRINDILPILYRIRPLVQYKKRLVERIIREIEEAMEGHA